MIKHMLETFWLKFHRVKYVHPNETTLGKKITQYLNKKYTMFIKCYKILIY